MDCLEYGLPLARLLLGGNQIEEYSVADSIKASRTLQVLDLSANRLDGANLWKLLDSVECSANIEELRADQLEVASSPKLVYKVCELLSNNRAVKRLYYSAEVPSAIVLVVDYSDDRWTRSRLR